jgi:predicted KAP-like P-loop ATPase
VSSHYSSFFKLFLQCCKLPGDLEWIQKYDGKTGALSQTIWFDAWLYENETDLLQALIRVVWQQYQTKNKAISVQKKELCQKALAIAGAIGTRWLSQRAGLGNLGFKAVLDDVNTIEDIPLENSIDLLVRNFKALLHELWGDRDIIIFIDDLDRCSPDSAVALLESIRSLLNATEDLNCQFVIIMDKSTLADAVRRKYAGLNSYDANRYLEKMFPQSFSVPQPKPAEVAALIHQQIDQLNTNNSNEKPDGVIQDNVEHIFISVLSKPEYANPRLIKRCLNRFAFFCHMQNQVYENNADLVLWLAAIERWPLLRRLSLRKADAFWLTFYRQLKNGGEIDDPDGKELATQPGVREFFATFDQDNVLLRMKQFSDIDKALSQYGL